MVDRALDCRLPLRLPVSLGPSPQAHSVCVCRDEKFVYKSALNDQVDL